MPRARDDPRRGDRAGAVLLHDDRGNPQPFPLEQIIERYGPAAILPYSYSGTLGLVQMSVASAPDADIER